MLDYLSLLLTALLWAGAFVVGKLSVGQVAPEMVAFLRFLFAGSIMLAILAVREPAALRLKKQDIWLVLALGATGIAAYNLLFFRGAKLALASDGGTIIPTLNPLITLFAAALILGEPLTRRKLLGAAVAIAGQVTIFWSLAKAVAGDPVRLAGDLNYVGAAVCWAAYTILGRVAAKRFSPLAATTWASLAGMVMLLPFALTAAPADPGAYSAGFWVQVLYIAVGGTVAGFVLWNRGVSRLGASRTAVFLNLVPVCTVAMAALLLGEQPTVAQVLGMGLVLCGVFIASRQQPAADTPANVS